MSGEVTLIPINNDNYFTITSSTSASKAASGIFLVSGDQVTYTFTLLYDHTNLPYYYKEIITKYSSSTQSITARIYIYLTPYNTIEIWDQVDFVNLNRSWFSEPGSSSDVYQTRIFIDKDSIPVSDVPDFSALRGSTQLDTIDENIDFNMVFIDGLGYAIPMMEDTTIQDDEALQKGGKKTFRGKIENLRIYTWHIADFTGAWHKIGLKNATVEIWRDKTGIDKKIKTVYTDNEGYIISSGGSRTVHFSTKSYKNTIKIYLKVKMISQSGRLRVKKPGSTSPISYETSTLNLSSTGNYELLNFGDIDLGVHRGGKQFSWTKWAWDLTNIELDDEGEQVTTHLKIIMRNNEGSFTEWGTRRIKIGSDRRDAEISMYHEFGHWVLYDLQDGHYAPNTGGEHSTSHDNKSPQETLVEGFASGYAFIMDEILFFLDDEANHNDAPSSENHHITFITSTNISHIYTAEYSYATLLLDIWDGNTNYTNYGYTSGTLPNQSAHYGDIDLGIQEDNFEMPLLEILRPFFEIGSSDVTVIQNVVQYYFELKTGDCIFDGEMSNIWRLNTYTGLGMDGIDLFVTRIAHDRYELSDDNGWEFVETYYYYYPNHDLDQLNNSNLSYNLGFPATSNSTLWAIQIPTYKFISVRDPLEIRDGAHLGFNRNESVLKVSGGLQNYNLSGQGINMVLSSPTPGSFQNFYVCGNHTVIDVGNGGSLLIGDASVNNTAEVRFERGTTIILRNGSNLTIDDNSKLIIECGARLIFEDGAGIILNGTNAKLEIYGHLEVGTNAAFTFTGTGSLIKYGYPNMTVSFHHNPNSSFVVSSGTTVELVAQTEIILTNFDAQLGSDVDIHIDPTIPNCDANSRLAATFTGSAFYDHPTDYNITNTVIETYETEEEEPEPVSIVEEKLSGSGLSGNYPNPHSSYTTIRYTVSENCPVRIFITDIKGNIMAELVNKEAHAVGDFEIIYNATGTKPGVYFYTLQTDKASQTKRMVVLK